jgi:hypothetical protein
VFTWTVKRLPWKETEAKAKGAANAFGRVRRAAEFVAERARMYCPVDSGDLKASIRAMPGPDGRTWLIVADMPYAVYVEFGTDHGSYFIPPNPFLRRAMMDGMKAYPDLHWGPVILMGRGIGAGAAPRRVA